MKANWMIIAFLGLVNNLQGQERYPEVQAIPPDKISKAWKAEIILSGKLEGYALNGANSVTLIDGYESFTECQKQASSIAQTLMNAAKSVGNDRWSSNDPSVTFGCHEVDMYID